MANHFNVTAGRVMTTENHYGFMKAEHVSETEDFESVGTLRSSRIFGERTESRSESGVGVI
jgi:hypothetical protein